MILFDTLVGGQAESQQSHCLFYQNKTKKTCPFLCQTKDIQKKKRIIDSKIDSTKKNKTYLESDI